MDELTVRDNDPQRDPPVRRVRPPAPLHFYADGTPVEQPTELPPPVEPHFPEQAPPVWPRPGMPAPGPARRVVEAAPVVAPLEPAAPPPLYALPVDGAYPASQDSAAEYVPAQSPVPYQYVPDGYVPVGSPVADAVVREVIRPAAEPIGEPERLAPLPQRRAVRFARPFANARLARPALPYAQMVGTGMARVRDASLVMYRRVRGARPVVPVQPPIPVAPLPPAPGIQQAAPLGFAWRQRLAPIYAYVRGAHILLAAGLIVLGLALAFPWATNRQGLPLYLGNFTSPKLAQAGVPVAGWAVSAASHLVIWGVILGIVLLVANVGAVALNLSAYRANMPGCLGGLLGPIITLAGLALLLDLALMAGFGLLGLLTQLPGLYAAGLTNQDAVAPAPGFFLWWVGVVLSFLGTVGLMNMRTRVLM